MRVINLHALDIGKIHWKDAYLAYVICEKFLFISLAVYKSDLSLKCILDQS